MPTERPRAKTAGAKKSTPSDASAHNGGQPSGSRTPINVVGHRGAMGVEPENTLRSFRRGLADGADAIELDVRRSADGVLVISHDSKVSRCTNGEGEIHELTLAELKKLDAGDGETIPTFDEVLDEVGDIPIQIELKAGDALPLVVETVRQRGLLDRIWLGSFHPEMLDVARYLLPEARRLLIFADAPADLVDRAKAVGAESVAPRITHLSRKQVADCHAAGLQVCTWLVNTAEDLRFAELLGADTVTTDYPELRASRTA